MPFVSSNDTLGANFKDRILNNNIKTTMGLREWSILLLLSVIWGGSFFFIKIIVVHLPTLTVVASRVALAAIALWLYIALKRLPVPKSPQIWKAFMTMGILNNIIPFTLIVWGQTEISSGLASILNATTPLFTILVAGILLPDERANPRKLIGVLAGLTGVIVMIGPGALQGLGMAVYAQLAILGAASSYALAGVYGRKFKALAVDPVITAAGQVTISTVFLIPLAAMIDKPYTLAMPGLEVWASLIALAVICTAFAYILYFQLLSTAGATNLLLVTFLIPVSANFLGITFLGEKLLATQIIGMAFIGLGLMIIDGRAFKYTASHLQKVKNPD